MLASLFDRGMFHNQVLTVVDAAETLGMSRTPVRMALSRLESEGLLVRTSPRGWSRVRIRVQDIDEIFDIKEALDPLLARKAAERCSPILGAELRTIIDEMAQAAHTSDVAHWNELQNRYHDRMLQIAGNRRLGETLHRLNNQLHHISAGHAAIRGRMADSVVEHRAVAEAVASGDGDLASRLALEHLQRMRKSIIEVVQTVLIGFVGDEV
jgi:DNA-binding GntR family transcriptional regulator